MKIIISLTAIQEMQELKFSNQKLVFKILDLMKEIEHTPFSGKGKPEALKGNLQGYWSRRVTEKHRLVYKVENDIVEIISCLGHYK